ncbi:oxidoreductase-like domain-containing protein [Pollutimonas bauzanensis]|uniref:oxidoreductase-like domain-containing protein n=1 Tax=Pollutimonas bauzanensis TaxID=658167 RepID=UPI0033414DEA
MTTPEKDPRPVPPPRPDSSDCCGGGCNPCVFEYYEDEMDVYRAELSAWEARHKPNVQPNKKPAG